MDGPYAKGDEVNKPWELTDDELAAIPRIALGQPFPAILRLTEKAAQRKLQAYQEQLCSDRRHLGYQVPRGRCPTCMADLRAKVEK